MINVGIVGCGTIATYAHIPSYMSNRHVNIKYLCDIDFPRAQSAAADCAHAKAVGDYREILKDKTIDAVSVCTPNFSHCDISCDFLQNGVNVLCEKPAAITYKDAQRMRRVCGDSGKLLDIGLVGRYDRAVNTARDIIQSGELGEVYHVYVSFRDMRSIPCLGGHFTTKSMSGGGALIDKGIHFIDNVLYCCANPKVNSVRGESFCKLGKNISDYQCRHMWAGPAKPDGVYDVEDFFTGMIFADSTVITLEGAWAQNIGKNESYIDFLGTKAGIRLKFGRNCTLYFSKKGKLFHRTVVSGKGKMYRNEINAFVESVKAGTNNRTSIDEILSGAKITQALYLSAKEHREVFLNEL